MIHTDLGAANAAKGSGNVVEVEMPSEQLDIDSGYDTALRNLRDRLEVPVSAISENQAQEDYYRAVRTYMVAVWMVANAILAMSVSEAYALEKGVADNTYLKFLLWSVAAVAIFRAIGSSVFAVMAVVAVVVEGRFREKVGGWLGVGGGKGSDGAGSAVGSSSARTPSEAGLTMSGISSGISTGLSVVGSKISSGFSWVSSRGGR